MGYLLLILAKGKWAVAFLALVGLSVFVPRVLEPGGAYTLQVPLDTAAGLYPGSDVEIGGARAGRIDDIRLEGATAVATISVEPQFAPVHRDAMVSLRPKSLLGEKYLALDPGQAGGTLPSGARLPKSAVTRSVDLEEVVNTFDQPTRDKLKVLVDELGGGVANEGSVQNQGLSSGRQDLDDLAAVADRLQQRDRDLKEVISSLSQVTDELARSDRRTQLGALIKNTEDLMRTLADQDAQIQRALGETDAALARTDAALGGAGGNLNDISRSLPVTVHYASGLTNDLSLGMEPLMAHLDQFIAGVQYGPRVFGGRDASGYATRISIIAGTGTLGLGTPGPASGGFGLPAPAGAVKPGLPGGAQGPAGGMLGGVIGFLLTAPPGGQG